MEMAGIRKAKALGNCLDWRIASQQDLGAAAQPESQHVLAEAYSHRPVEDSRELPGAQLTGR
jgi:hypothetical protein